MTFIDFWTYSHMNIFSWVIFAFINAIVLFFIDYDPAQNKMWENFILGFTGALSSSIFIFFLAQGKSPEFTILFSIVIFLEAFLLLALFLSKSFTRSLHA